MKTDNSIDYYSVLGVEPTATEDEIKKAFRKQALLHHPDRNPGKEEEAKARFQNVQIAHDVLADKVKRDKYDRDRRKQDRSASSSSPAPQPQPASGTTAFQYAQAARGGHPAHASRYAAFAKKPHESFYTPNANPPRDSSYNPGVNSKFEKFKAWENIRGGHRPSPPQTSPPRQPPRGAPTAQRPPRARQDWDEDSPTWGSSPRRAPGLNRSQSTRTPKRSGFDPTATGGDEPGYYGSSAYQTNRSERAQTAESRYRDSPAGSHGRPQSMAAEAPRPNLADTLGETYSSDRISTPYANKSGERTYFTSADIGRYAKSSSSARPPGAGRHRSASPGARSSLPEEDETSPSESEDELYTDQMKRSQQAEAGRRASADPRLHTRKATVEDDTEHMPGSFPRPDRQQTWSESSPTANTHSPFSNSGQQRVYERPEPSPLRTHFDPPPQPTNTFVPGAVPGARPPMYDYLDSPLNRRTAEHAHSRNSQAAEASQKQTWPYWAIPSSISPVVPRLPSGLRPVEPKSRRIASSAEAYMYDLYADPFLPHPRFSIPSNGSSSATPSKKPSTENVDVQFSPSWQGPFTGASDYMGPHARSGRAGSRGSPPKGPAAPSAHSSSPSPTKDTGGGLASQQMPPPPPPNQSNGVSSPPPSAQNFSSQEWSKKFEGGNGWAMPAQNLPPRPFQTPRARSSRTGSAQPKQQSRGSSERTAVSGGEDTGNDGDDEARQSGNNDTEGELSRSASVSAATAMDIDEDTPPGNASRNTSAPPTTHATVTTPSPSSGTAFPRPPEPSTGFNMQGFRNIFPLGGSTSGGLAGMKNDLSSTLPFESGASNSTRTVPKPQRLELPHPPKPPLKPSHFTQVACDFYMKKLAVYMREWQTFNARMLDHFSARQSEAVSMTKNTAAAAERGFLPMCNGIGGSGANMSGPIADIASWSWMGARGDDGYLKYMSWLKEDDQVERHWDEARDVHRKTIEDLGQVRKVMKALSSAK